MGRGLALAGAGLLAGVFLLAPQWLPPCPVHALTGLYCPGCGSGRAFHALLRADWGAAFAFNPLLFALIPLLVVLAVRDRRAASTPMPRGALAAILIGIAAFGLLRNIPGISYLGPESEKPGQSAVAYEQPIELPQLRQR